MSAVSTHLATVALATLLVSGVPTAPLSAEAQEGVEVETTEQTYFGAPVNMGEGVARVVVRTDGAGDPEALGVEFTDGLPQERAEDRSLGWHRFLAHVNEMGLHTVPKDALGPAGSCWRRTPRSTSGSGPTPGPSCPPGWPT